MGEKETLQYENHRSWKFMEIFSFGLLPPTTRVSCYCLSCPRVDIVAISRERKSWMREDFKMSAAPGIIVGVAVLCGGTLLHPSVVWVARPLLQQINYQLWFIWSHSSTFSVGRYEHLWVSSALVPTANRISRIGCVARSWVTSCPFVPATDIRVQNMIKTWVCQNLDQTILRQVKAETFPLDCWG